MRPIDADALPRHGQRGGLVHWKDIEDAPTIVLAKQVDEIIDAIRKALSAQSAKYPHGLIVPLPMPIRGCCFCIFRDGNLCRFLPDNVEVVEAAKLEQRHELCPLVEV